MTAPDGGPAFPSHGTMGEVNHQGMSLRDWFSGMVLMLMSQRQAEKLEYKKLAEHAYKLADAMLNEREKLVVSQFEHEKEN